MTIGQRIKKFIVRVYGTQKKFADQVQISRAILNRYIADTNLPGADVLYRFKKAGMSIDWLLDGSGSMYAKDFKIQHIEKDINVASQYLPHQRIKKWIGKNYGTLENFAVIMNLYYYMLENFLENELVPDPNFTNILRMAGCNIRWLSTGDGEEYAQNNIGHILKMRNEQSEIQDEEINPDEINQLPTGEFYKLIRSAIKKESKENDDDDE